MKYLLISIFSLYLFTTQPTDTTKVATNKPTVVLQLFTSQGCSSCPRADEYLNIIKKEYAANNVIVLSYHVDYWDYIGWKDPFSKKEYSELQATYGRQLKARNIYTPQLVVNGKVHYVGSDKTKIKNSIFKNLKINAENAVVFSALQKSNTNLNLKYKIKGDVIGKKLQLALVLDHKTTKVKGGENSDRTLSNSNIVIETLTKEIQVKEGELSIAIPPAYKNEKKLRVIGFVQNEQLHITGGTQVKV